jgi:alpha-beta hydrolase superfamily lysophospholipase
MEFKETKCEVFEADSNTKLLSHMWLPDGKTKAIFIAIHGGMAHAGDWVTPALFFKKKGIATYALDLRWHGTFDKYNENTKIFFHIDSYDQYTEDIHKYIAHVKENNPGVPVFILGHSNGALISLYYGLTKGQNEDIKGYVLSSPWLVNKVKIPAAIKILSKVLAVVNPKFSVAPDPLTDVLTHDKEITARHHEDEAKGIRGQEASAKLGVESQKTQNYVIDNIQKWNNTPLFVVIAGKDELADYQSTLDIMGKIPEDTCTMVVYEDNFHENFNEVNRNEIFEKIWKWLKV